MKNKTFILFAILLLTTVSAMGQRRHRTPRFDYNINAGITLNQIDGDNAGSYNQFGFHAGVNTTFTLTDDTESPWRMMVEVGIMQKGSRVPNINRLIRLTYVQLPLALTYNIDGTRSHTRLGVGVAPGYLTTAYVSDGGVQSPVTEGNFRSMDRMPFFVDLQYRVGDHWGFEGRVYNSMLSIVDEAGTGTYRIFRSNKGVFSRNVMLGVSYHF